MCVAKGCLLIVLAVAALKFVRAEFQNIGMCDVPTYTTGNLHSNAYPLRVASTGRKGARAWLITNRENERVNLHVCHDQIKLGSGSAYDYLREGIVGGFEYPLFAIYCR